MNQKEKTCIEKNSNQKRYVYLFLFQNYDDAELAIIHQLKFTIKNINE